MGTKTKCQGRGKRKSHNKSKNTRETKRNMKEYEKAPGEQKLLASVLRYFDIFWRYLDLFNSHSQPSKFRHKGPKKDSGDLDPHSPLSAWPPMLSASRGSWGWVGHRAFRRWKQDLKSCHMWRAIQPLKVGPGAGYGRFSIKGQGGKSLFYQAWTCGTNLPCLRRHRFESCSSSPRGEFGEALPAYVSYWCSISLWVLRWLGSSGSWVDEVRGSVLHLKMEDTSK